MPSFADPVGAFVDQPGPPVASAPDGPLAGLTFAVKDIFDVAGWRTGCGNPTRLAEAAPAAAHAPAVAMLLEAGARFAGKTHTAEMAFSLDGRSAHYRTPENPRAPGRVPGGSSSGSASAVAAGLVDFALGSDTGGSVRGPASFCGIIGLRTTQGRIDAGGALPLAPSLDTVGWFADDIAVYAAVGEVLLGPDADGPPLRRMLIAEDAQALLLGAEEDSAVRSALARVAEHLEPAGAVTVAAEGLATWQGVFRTTQGFEAWRAHGAWLQSRRPTLGPGTAERFAAASRVSPADYEAAQARRAQIAGRMRGLLGEDAVLALPTMPTAAPRMDAAEAELEQFRARALSMLCIAGLAGLPQISLPLAEVGGLPLGVSLIGPPGRDKALIALARRLLAG